MALEDSIECTGKLYLIGMTSPAYHSGVMDLRDFGVEMRVARIGERTNLDVLFPWARIDRIEFDKKDGTDNTTPDTTDKK